MCTFPWLVKSFLFGDFKDNLKGLTPQLMSALNCNMLSDCLPDCNNIILFCKRVKSARGIAFICIIPTYGLFYVFIVI